MQPLKLNSGRRSYAVHNILLRDLTETELRRVGYLNERIRRRLEVLERKLPVEEETGLPEGTTVFQGEWEHPDPKICQALPKRENRIGNVRVIMYDPADSVSIFDADSNLKLIKCGWCSHFLKDCNGANYYKFDLESLRSAKAKTSS